jgi:hypothetical protein
MKLSLLSTTALISIGLATVAGGPLAQAAGAVQPGLGGYYELAGDLFEQGDKAGEHDRNPAFAEKVDAPFEDEAVLENGLAVGARIEMEGRRSADATDEAGGYFNGGRGQVRSGDDDAGRPGYFVPSASNIFGVNSLDFGPGNDPGSFANGAFQTDTTLLDMPTNATKIIYFSPAFGGFSFAVSSALDRSDEDSNSYSSRPGGTTFSNGAGQTQSTVSAAVEFDRNFGDLRLASGLGFAGSQWENPVPRQAETSWGVNGHLDLTYEGFTLGGSMAYRSNYTTFGGGSDFTVYGVGATYNWDLWTLGLAWSHGNYQYISSNEGDDLDIVQFTGRYDLGPGLSLDAMVGINNLDTASGSPRSDGTAWQGGMGFYIGF